MITSPVIAEQAAPAPVVATTAMISTESSAGAQTFSNQMTLPDTDLDSVTTPDPVLTSGADTVSAGTGMTDQTDDPVGDASFVVQLGAFRSRTGAITEIATLQETFPEQLATSGLNIDADRMADGSNMFRIMTDSRLMQRTPCAAFSGSAWLVVL